MGFSPDQTQLVVGGSGGVRVLHADGSAPLVVDDVTEFRDRFPVFTPDGEHLLLRIGKAMQPYHAPEGRAEIGLWSLQKEAFVREFLLEGITFPVRFGDRIDFVTSLPGEFEIRKWPGDGHEPVLHGRATPADGQFGLNTDQGYTWHAVLRGREVYVCRTDSLFDPALDHRPVWERARRLGEHADEIRGHAFNDAGTLLATADASGEIRVWSPTAAPDAPLRVLQAQAPVRGIALNRDGTLLAARCGTEKTVTVWDLEGPRDALPRVLPHRGNRYFAPIRFDPTGQWLLAGFMDEIAIWPATRPDRYVLDGLLWPMFSADSRTVFGTKSSRRVVASRSLHDKPGQDLFEETSALYLTGDPDPSGEWLAISGGGSIQLFHLDDGTTRKLADLSGGIEALAWSWDGERIAYTEIIQDELQLCLVDVATGESRILERRPYYFPQLAFSSDGSLVAASDDGTLRRWDLDTGTTTVVARGSLPAASEMGVSRDGRYALAAFAPQAFQTPTSRSELRLCDLAAGTSRVITNYGDNVVGVWLAPDGRSMAVRDFSGAIRIGPTTGEQPHLLVGPAGMGNLAVSPDGRWLAADTNPWNTSTDTTTTLWPMPEGRPLHALPHAEFLAHLRAQTNVRVAADPEADSGYRVVTEPFPGLANLPRPHIEAGP
jgi:WD40 repeat protein